ncbi:MAG: replicative DNA helicase [Puniceicoccales bacterium]|nr:replicative DNA helicase [Puniceicoccales bacterium]
MPPRKRKLNRFAGDGTGAPPSETQGVPTREMPHNMDAEQALLASCMRRGGADILNECGVRGVTDEFFYSLPNQCVFRAMSALLKDGIAIDELTVTNKLAETGELEAAGGAGFVAGLHGAIGVQVTAHALHWLKIVQDRHIQRRLIRAAMETVEEAHNPTDEIKHLLESVEEKFFAISEAGVSANTVQHIEKPVNEASLLIEKLQNNRNSVTGIPTGFPRLNSMCYGFHEGQMIVVAARPAMGKTSMALNFIEAALFSRRDDKGDPNPAPTLMFSLEMPAPELAMRLLCSYARVSLEEIRSGRASKENLSAITNAGVAYKKMPLFIDDQGGQTILEIRSKARRLVKKHGIKLIVIDYLQLINGTDNSIPREQQIAEASRSIKAMAKEFKLPIIALAQLNRKNEDENRQPRISDLRESGSIEQDADMVLLIDKKRKGESKRKQQGAAADGEEKEEATLNADKHHIYERVLIIAKQRNGPTGDVKLLFNGDLTRFETPASEYANGPDGPPKGPAL